MRTFGGSLSGRKHSRWRNFWMWPVLGCLDIKHLYVVFGWFIQFLFFLWDLHHDKNKRKLFSSLLFRHVKMPTLLKLYNTNNKKAFVGGWRFLWTEYARTLTVLHIYLSESETFFLHWMSSLTLCHKSKIDLVLNVIFKWQILKITSGWKVHQWTMKWYACVFLYFGKQ